MGGATPRNGPLVSCKDIKPCCNCAPCTVPHYDCAVFGPLAFAVDLSDCLAGVSFDLGCPPDDWCKVVMKLRKRGFSSRPHPFLIEYKPFALESTQLVFRFDSLMNRLPPARYEAVVLDGTKECGSFELRVKDKCLVSLRTYAELPYHGIAPALRRPQGGTAMFDAIAGFDAATCSVLDVGATGLPLSSADQAQLCAKLVGMCQPVQLVVDDGVNRETIKVSGCVNGVPQVQRAQAGTRQHRFPKGARLRFEWTPDNVTAMMAGCP